jgi:hypothetical protein
MKDRPILFSAPMVRAILDGRKTQTRRRVVKSFRTMIPAMGVELDCVKDLDGQPSRLDLAPDNWEICPYGVPGDRLWVRETWAAPHDCDHLKPKEIPEGTRIHYMASWEGPCGLLRRPSIFIPRWASRITLEVVNVRVERLQDISDRGASNDCTAEGVFHCGMDVPRFEQWSGDGFNSSEKWMYRTLWNKINGAGAWDKNPWVWVLEFKRITHQSSVVSHHAVCA